MCISDGELRAKIDGELPEAELKRVQAHLEGCAGCRRREEEMAGRAARVGALFSGLAEGEPAPDAAAAYARFRRARAEQPAERTWWRARLLPPRLAWAAMAAAALAGMLLVSPPTRALAQKLLGILRINTVVAVPIQRDFANEGKGQMLSQILADSVTTTKKGRPLNVAGREQAAQVAGFTPRLPGLRTDEPQLTVNTEQAFHFTLNEQRLTALVTALNRPDLALPPDLNGAQVFVDAPPSVVARYGDCPAERFGAAWRNAHVENCLTVVQAPIPVVVTQPQIDLRGVAEFGLQISGMTPEEARTFSQAVDWTTTIAIPVPRSASSYDTVTVDGAKGVLVSGVTMPIHDANLPPAYALIWVKDGRMYSLAGFGTSTAAVPLAESMK